MVANCLMNSLLDKEWACIAPNKVVVATADRAWLHHLNSVESGDPFAQQMLGAGNLVTTQKLLDGVISAAFRDTRSNRKPPAMTATRWVWRLAGAYHSSRHTTRLMEQAAENFAASGRTKLVEWALQKAKEEAGHDRLALLDIQSMGYDAEAVVQALVPSAITDYVDYFTQIAHESDPIGCVGLSYASERLGIFKGEEYIQSINALLPPGTNATRWLRIHSGVGDEVDHVEDLVELVAGLTPEERVRVAQVCYETALLRFRPPKEEYLSDEELERILQPLKLGTSLQAKPAS